MATPAEPILASALWAACQAAKDETTEPLRRNHVTGCESIDNTFAGALQHGKLCCISAEANSGGRELCEAYLVSHLLSSPDATATVIDTSLSFDVRKLHRMLLARLQGHTGAEHQAMEALERLKIMKVFDFEGLTDSISELRDSLESVHINSDAPTAEYAAPRGTIGDSEDEEEMLDSPSPPADLQVAMRQNIDNEESPSKGLLLIDSISHVAAPMIKNRHVEGQALLISFMRSLSHLTTAHQLFTILLNNAIPKANMKDESPSIFATCAVRPALGRSFEHTLDTHLLVHRAPTKIENNPGYRSEQQGGQVNGEKVVSVVEVLLDRNGGALGRWAAFAVGDDGRLEDFK